MSLRPRPTVLIALLALALLVPATAAALDRTVSVNGSATLKVPNDTASLGFSVGLERKTRGAALRAVSSQLRGVIAAVQGVPGVGPGDVKTGRISVHKTSRGKRPVYKAAEGIGVTLHQPDKAGDLVAAAISAGATGLSGPNFFVGDTEAAFARALAAAFDNAKSKATALATEAGATLGPAISIDEGSGGEVFGAPNSKDVPSSGCGTASPSKRANSGCAGSLPVKPGTSTVTATVRVVFALQ
jgi:uncharacterized protein YggE